MSVAGGQTAMSLLAYAAPAMIARSSARLAVTPFIFQLPAASGRRSAIPDPHQWLI
jgi:hypothetical protein